MVYIWPQKKSLYASSLEMLHKMSEGGKLGKNVQKVHLFASVTVCLENGIRWTHSLY